MWAPAFLLTGLLAAAPQAVQTNAFAVWASAGEDLTLSKHRLATLTVGGPAHPKDLGAALNEATGLTTQHERLLARYRDGLRSPRCEVTPELAAQLWNVTWGSDGVLGLTIIAAYQGRTRLDGLQVMLEVAGVLARCQGGLSSVSGAVYMFRLCQKVALWLAERGRLSVPQANQLAHAMAKHRPSWDLLRIGLERDAQQLIDGRLRHFVGNDPRLFSWEETRDLLRREVDFVYDLAIRQPPNWFEVWSARGKTLVSDDDRMFAHEVGSILDPQKAPQALTKLLARQPPLPANLIGRLLVEIVRPSAPSVVAIAQLIATGPLAGEILVEGARLVDIRRRGGTVVTRQVGAMNISADGIHGLAPQGGPVEFTVQLDEKLSLPEAPAHETGAKP